MGDSNLQMRPKGKNAYLSFAHKSDHEEYLDYKINLFRDNICGITKRPNDYSGYLGFRAYTKCHPLLTKIYRWAYEKNHKRVSEMLLDHLTPLGLALWYMDDGYLGFIKKNGKIHGREIKIYSMSFTFEEHERMVNYFKKRWGINWRIAKSTIRKGKYEGRFYYNLSTGATEGFKFFKLIAPYIPTCMNYKVDMKYIYSSYAGRPFNWSEIQSALGSNVETATEMMAA